MRPQGTMRLPLACHPLLLTILTRPPSSFLAQGKCDPASWKQLSLRPRSLPTGTVPPTTLESRALPRSPPTPCSGQWGLEGTGCQAGPVDTFSHVPSTPHRTSSCSMWHLLSKLPPDDYHLKGRSPACLTRVTSDNLLRATPMRKRETSRGTCGRHSSPGALWAKRASWMTASLGCGAPGSGSRGAGDPSLDRLSGVWAPLE